VKATTRASRARTEPTVLLTGFAPFDGETINPSWLAVRELDGAMIARHRVHALELPVSFTAMPRALDAAIEHVAPRLVLCVGQAGGRPQISLERVAVNLVDARIADADGLQPIDQPVIADAPDAYLSTLPLKAMLAALRRAGIPAEISLSAGAYVCNACAFHLAHRIAQGNAGLRGGFVHIPWAPSQAATRPGQPSLATAVVIEALRVMVRAALRPEAASAGAEAGTH
jgi:pyroglutamyl-peptidase